MNSQLQVLFDVLVDRGQRIRKLAEDGKSDAMLSGNVNNKSQSGPKDTVQALRSDS
jgi:hypothetical protein